MNVIDHYKLWLHDAIKGDLDERRHNFSILCYNLGMDFNIASVIRNSNAFLAQQVYIYPKKRFDRRGCVGTHKYENLRHVTHLDDITHIPNDTVWVGVDNVDGAKAIETFEWPDSHVMLCFGSEGMGLPPEILARCKHTVFIRQYGSVRSLNVAVAAGIAMYDLMTKRGE